MKGRERRTKCRVVDKNGLPMFFHAVLQIDETIGNHVAEIDANLNNRVT
jgi:hypothetical protein